MKRWNFSDGEEMPVRVKLRPTTLRGAVSAPPSKSQAHRLILAAALAKGTCSVDHITESDDIRATIDAVRAMGGDVRMENGTGGKKIIIGSLKKQTNNRPVVDCKESGSTLRFVLPLALVIGNGAVFTGSGR